MPININVGLSKKVGLPNYGSLAASCSVQIEAGHGLLEGNLAEFQRRVCESFAACRQAIEDELNRQQGSNSGKIDKIGSIIEGKKRKKDICRPAKIGSIRSGRERQA